MKLLKQTTTGEIYVWDEELAKRPDMEDYVRPEVKPAPAPVVEAVEVEAVEAEPAPAKTVKKKGK